MGEAMGCGGRMEEASGEFLSIERELLPMWQALPKNEQGRVERQSLRHMVRRYFRWTSSLVLRGFDKSAPSNQSDFDLLSQRVPAYMESMLESKHAQEHGFDLHDAVYMVAVLKHLLFDSDGALLEKVYREQGKPVEGRSLSRDGLSEVLESYIVHWLMGSDAEGIRILLSNRTLLESVFPHWHGLADYVRGEIRAEDFQWQRAPAAISPATGAYGARRPGGSGNALTLQYSFDDAHEIVTGITKNFASFWESECSSLKATLVTMDSSGTGRVPLSRFYASALDSEWRFGESEEYLRELGLLDESSAWRGKQVIIPNYIQAASNCIVSSPHYLVCCVDECEGILREIETAVRAPVATPDLLLAVVGNMTSQTTLDDDQPIDVDGTLAAQLRQIAVAHDGKVPLHGRLFAQWLHYAFPRECSFPHKVGQITSLTPLEFGDKYMATNEEMRNMSASVNTSETLDYVSREDAQWMSQWSSEEELLLDYSSELRAPWEPRYFVAGGSVAILAAVVMAASKAHIEPTSRRAAQNGDLLPLRGKAHYI
jgi:hypothetical protein